MNTYKIITSWGDSCVFHADRQNLRNFGEAIEEAVYILCEMNPGRCSYENLASALIDGEAVKFDYHGTEEAFLKFDGKSFFLNEAE